MKPTSSRQTAAEACRGGRLVVGRKSVGSPISEHMLPRVLRYLPAVVVADERDWRCPDVDVVAEPDVLFAQGRVDRHRSDQFAVAAFA